MKRLGMASALLAVLFIASLAFAAGQDQQAAGQDQGMTGAQGMQQQDMTRASELMGKTLVNNQQEELGEVQDLILSKDGKISHLVISRGGVLGMGEDLIPIPWDAAQADFQGDQLIVNMDKQKLQDAPSFQAGNWEEFYSEETQQQVRGYYGEGQAPGTEAQPYGTEKPETMQPEAQSDEMEPLEEQPMEEPATE